MVDDEPDVVKSIADFLRLDYRVLGATRPQAALKILEQEEVHVVMSDQRMPEMTGVEFLTKVRISHPQAIRLMFTGYADIRAVIEAINHGNIYRYITKPWDPDELKSVIQQAVERYDLILQREQLSAELHVNNAKLEQANQLKTAFIRVASHELRTPLTILIGSAALARQKLAGDHPARQSLDSIDRASQWLHRLVDQMLTMLLVGQFEIKPDRQPLELGQFMRQCADDVALFVEMRQQKLEVDIERDLNTLSLDVSMMRDALDHLLLNAIKFTPDGGDILLTAREAGPQIQIEVKDSGIGIDSAHMPQLFEPFFTGFDVSRHSSGVFEHCKQGLGLGLSLVKAFVEMHGGTITADSAPDQGSTFTILLPNSSNSR